MSATAGALLSYLQHNRRDLKIVEIIFSFQGHSYTVHSSVVKRPAHPPHRAAMDWDAERNKPINRQLQSYTKCRKELNASSTKSKIWAQWNNRCVPCTNFSRHFHLTRHFAIEMVDKFMLRLAFFIHICRGDNPSERLVTLNPDTEGIALTVFVCWE